MTSSLGHREHCYSSDLYSSSRHAFYHRLAYLEHSHCRCWCFLGHVHLPAENHRVCFVSRKNSNHRLELHFLHIVVNLWALTVSDHLLRLLSVSQSTLAPLQSSIAGLQLLISSSCQWMVILYFLFSSECQVSCRQLSSSVWLASALCYTWDPYWLCAASV